MTALSSRSLPRLGRQVPVPSYDRGDVTPGIVHFGVGAFHRAHQALYLDRLMNQGQALDWGICGVGLQPSDQRMRDVMAAQDGLYTLVLKHPDGTWEPRIVGSIVEYLFAPDDPELVIEKMATPAIRIVSLTITEGGYNFNPATGEFDETNPEVVADLLAARAPRTVFGLVVEALLRRRERGIPPFTVVSCDNIPGNGDAARNVFASFARLRDPEMGRWVDENVRFPNSMVDRITPATTDADRREVSRRFGVKDDWPVLCEPFIQWIVEDAFNDGRPPLEEVGVQFVARSEPYELMKLRLLNAGHQALCYSGYLVGYRLAHEVAQDPLFSRYLLDYMNEEAAPTLQPVPGIDLKAYAEQLVNRFSNRELSDTLARLCADTSDRIPKFLLPVIRHQLATGGPIDRSVAVIACWSRYAEGVDESGTPINVVDPLRLQLTTAANRQREEPLAFLENRDVFGDLIDDERFTASYQTILASLRRRGVRATLKSLPLEVTVSLRDVRGRAPDAHS